MNKQSFSARDRALEFADNLIEVAGGDPVTAAEAINDAFKLRATKEVLAKVFKGKGDFNRHVDGIYHFAMAGIFERTPSKTGKTFEQWLTDNNYLLS